MPVATFPGNRGWGYTACTRGRLTRCTAARTSWRASSTQHTTAGLAMILDVVYNHVGPGSEALSAFGPYFKSDAGTLGDDGDRLRPSCSP